MPLRRQTKKRRALTVLVIVIALGTMAAMSEKCKGGKEPGKEPGKEQAMAPTSYKLLDKKAQDLSGEEMKNLRAVIETDNGDIKLKFYPEQAPNHVRNFIKLAQSGFYNGLIFHRVIKGFMIQGGDPNGTGGGGPGWHVNAEFSSLPHNKGTLSMARTNDPNSAGSQFFICLEKSSFLDGKYSVFGQVVEGQDVVDKIGSTPTGARDRPVTNQVMKKVYIETPAN